MKIFLLLATLLFTTLLNAEVKDKWKLNVGTMFVTNFETELQVTPKNYPVSARINTQDQLHMENETNVLRLDGYYRFTDTHSISASYFSVKSEGRKSINGDISWNDHNISAGANVSSYFNMNVYKVNYGYSFYHNNDVELMLTAGLHITSIELGLAATGTINGTTGSYSDSAKVTAPLPVIGFKGEYTIIDKTLFVQYQSDYFALEYEGLKGNLISSSLNIEYRFVEHVGVGLGYNANNLYLKADDGNKKIEAQNNVSGALLYLTYIY